MGKINILDISVANMIAAGEVVERPASVIKELVENSIDAGADKITIEIKNGGISYMRVTDNGKGIDPDDMGLAFVRHATSKIKEAVDLEAIGTLGFRGEALCSIAAVSNVIMTSKTADSPTAMKVYIEGGEMEDVSETGAPNGTTIEVKKLFYNTPARMKFMKKDTTEAGYITDIVQKFILAHPEVSFRYINNGKQLLLSPGDGSLVNAIYTVYGRDYAKSLIEVNYGDNMISVSGFVGKSSISRPNRTYQSFFVNGRYIKSRSITVALDEAYKNQLMGGKFPFAVININVNPAFVDVNVHPNKTEVKFSDEKKVFDTVYWGVKNALYEKPIIPDVSIAEKRDAYKLKQFYEKDKTFVQTLISLDDKTEKTPGPEVKTVAPEIDVKEFIYEQKKPEPIKTAPATEKKQIIIDEKVQIPKYDENAFKVTKTNTEDASEAPDKPLSFKEDSVPYQVVSKPSNEDVSKTAEVIEHTEEKPQNEYENYKIAGTLFDTYIILECGDKALLIDQHAAHERIKFEQLKRDIENNGIKIQSLIAPVVVDLSAGEAAFAEENKQKFYELGFDTERFGENSYIINGAPSDMDYNDIKDLFVELLGQMMSDKKNIIGARDERALYTVACKAAIKANKALTEPEIRALADAVLSLDNINTCPHGRPIMVSLTKYELEKQFKRIV